VELGKTTNSQNAILLGTALVATLSFWFFGIASSSSTPHLRPELRSKNEAYFCVLVAPSLSDILVGGSYDWHSCDCSVQSGVFED